MAKYALSGLATGWGVLLLLFGSFSAFSVSPDPQPSDIFAVDVLELLGYSALYGGTPGLVVGVLIGGVLHSHDKRYPTLPPPAPVDRWSAVVANCEESVRRVAAVVTTIPASPAKDWMSRIAAQFADELEDVRGIAALARAIGAVDERHPVSQRLFAAARDFAAFEAEVGRVALTMFDHPELDRARTDLEFLEQQLPTLRA